jgi:hypothetical protein
MSTTFTPTRAVYTELYRRVFRIELIHDPRRTAWSTMVHRIDRPDYWQVEVPGIPGDYEHALYVAHALADLAAAPPQPAPF